MSTTDLLHKRNQWKSKKPTFIRQDYQKTIRLRDNWRRPEGMHSKMRRKLRGNRRSPSIGFSSPRQVRSLTRDGYRLHLISNPQQLDTITEPITIAASVGIRKRIAIAKKAKEKKLRILNIRDVDAFIAQTEAALKQRKELKKQQQTTKEKKKEERVKKAEEKQKEETPEEKEKREKEEKRKVLERK